MEYHVRKSHPTFWKRPRPKTLCGAPPTEHDCEYNERPKPSNDRRPCSMCIHIRDILQYNRLTGDRNGASALRPRSPKGVTSSPVNLPRCKYAPAYHARECVVQQPPIGYGVCSCGVDAGEPASLIARRKHLS